MKFFTTTVFLYLFLFTVFAQEQSSNDSLELLLGTQMPDTSRINILIRLSQKYEKINQEKAIHFALKALEIANNKNIDSKIFSNIYSNLGSLHMAKHDYLRSLEYYQKSLNHEENLLSYVNIGNIHLNLKDEETALKYFSEALAFNKEDLGNNENYNESLYQLIGHTYRFMGNYDSAVAFYQNSLNIALILNDKSFIAHMYKVFGDIYTELGDLESALEYLRKSIALYEELNNPEKILSVYPGISRVYLELEDLDNALYYSELAFNKGYSENTAEILSEIFARIGDYQKAYEYHKIFKNLSDSIFDNSLSREIANLESQNIFNQEKKVMEAQTSRQKFLRNSFIGASVLLLILAFLIFRSYRIKRKANLVLSHKNALITHQKEEIESQRDEIETQRDMVQSQKEEIEHSQHEITDSINYARRLQKAIMPHDEIRDKLLNEHFIYFKPKDIVSGDFYWLTHIEERTVVAAADCTGHGVPGAFMSMLGISYLNEIVNNEYITHPGVILRRLRKKVIQALKQKGEPGEQQDGMDIALCSIDYKTLQLEFSGAHNPLFIIRKKDSSKIPASEILENDQFALYEIKGCKMPISIHIQMDKFDHHIIDLRKNDCLYMFSDGYADQFGGPAGKKFKYRPFKELLLSHCHKPMSEQMEALDRTLNEWKGDFEQIDDILVMGIRI